MRYWLWLVVACAVFWVVSFLHFIDEIPRNPVGDSVTTEAIVVLTGGSLRISYGFELLEKGKAQKLFITGVGKDSDIVSLMDAHDASDAIRVMVQTEADPSITLGYQADSTRGNAHETAEWAARTDIKSIRLVTSNYHLPRSMMEFKRVMPDMILIPDPVFPNEFLAEDWWHDEVSRTLVLSEFHKYLVASFYWMVQS